MGGPGVSRPGMSGPVSRDPEPPSPPAAAGGKGVSAISVKTLGGRLAALRASYAERGLGTPPGMDDPGMDDPGMDGHDGPKQDPHNRDPHKTALVRRDAMRHRTGLHPVVFVSLFACFAAMMLAFVMLFWERPEPSFMVAISFGFLFVYAGLPLLMLRFEARGGPTLAAFPDMRLRIWTGSISGADAWLQICLVPLVLAVGAAALCVIVLLTRAG